MTLILASQSVARRQMLDAADVPCEAMAAGVDEESAKAAFQAQGLSARDLADALAELKATKLSIRHPGDLYWAVTRHWSLRTALYSTKRLTVQTLLISSGYYPERRILYTARP
jgi:hypothetical protein